MGNYVFNNMTTLKYLTDKYNIPLEYIEIPNIGRKELADMFHELDFKRGVEIGVANGEYSEAIMGANPSIEMYGVDPYVSYEGYKDYKLKSTFTRMEQEAQNKLWRYQTYKFIKKFSLEASKGFNDSSLDFVYIDGNHEGHAVKEDIEAWTPKVRKGGIVAGHDFTGRWPSLRKEVISYCNNSGRILFILGMERKDLGLYRDTSRSWFFVV